MSLITFVRRAGNSGESPDFLGTTVDWGNLRQWVISSDQHGLEKILQADPAEQFRACAVGDGVDSCRPIVIRAEMNFQRTLSERHVHDIRNCACDILWGRILRRKLRESRKRDFTHVGGWTIRVFFRPNSILRPAGSDIVAGSESTGNDDGRLDAPTCELAGVTECQRIQGGFR